MKTSRYFLAIVILLCAYEIIALGQHNGETISEIFWRASTRPIVPFAMGVLMGHFFWQRNAAQ